MGRSSTRMSHRGPARATVVLVVALALAVLGLAPSAFALSIAPEAAKLGEKECAPGAECTTTQPSTPGWLTLVNGEAELTRQRLAGVAANEYGSKPTADTTLFGSAQDYAQSPKVEGEIVGSALANLAGSREAGDDDAIVLRADRTLEVLGPQAQGYELAAEASVPGSEKLIGVVAEAAAPGSGDPERIVVVAESGFYVYTWTDAGSPALTLLSKPPAGLPGEGEKPSGDSAFECEASLVDPTPRPGNCEFSYQPYELVVPEERHVLDVYQAPPGKGEYEGASSTFAIAYSGGAGPNSYTVYFFAYTGGKLSLIDQIQETFPAGETGPLKVAYATAGKYLRAATLAQSPGSADETMKQFNFIPANGFLYSSTGASPTVSHCPPSEAGELGMLAVDAAGVEPAGGGSPGVYSGVSVCAGLLANRVFYVVQRNDQGGAMLSSLAEKSADVLSISEIGSFEAPNGDKIGAVDATVDFPCDEYLSQFAAHPTPDGFPDTGSGPDYCGPVEEGRGGTFFGTAPYGPQIGAAGMVAAQFQYVSEEGGLQTLRQHSLSFEPEAEVAPPFHELKTKPKSAFEQYDEQLSGETQLAGGEQRGSEEPARISRAAKPSVTMLPLDPAEAVWSGKLVLNSNEKVIKAAGTSNPVPIAAMAAPPYYAGAEQQVTPTSTAFSKSSCEGAGAEQNNTAGVFAGVDVTWAEDEYEVEALAKVEASWTQATEAENCQELDQEFIAGNFGNNYRAENSLLFRVDTGTNTYMNLTRNSLGVGVTTGCEADHLAKCDPLFDPEGSQYALQTLGQLKHPQPNDFYAADDERLNAQFGAALEATLPKPGDPASYPAPAGEPSGCAPAEPSGSGSGNAGIVDVNPFVAPTPKPAPNLLQAPQESEVNPASGGDEAGTSSTLSYDESKETSSSAEFSVGAEVSVKLGYAKFGAEYSHGWGTDMTQSFQTGTEFAGGVYDFNGFYDPYSYRLYECKSELQTKPGFEGEPRAKLPVFLVDYTTSQSADGLPLNFVTPSLPEGTAGQEYSGQVFLSGGVPGYTYTIASGALPPGVGLDEATGQLSGTPTAAGTYEFTVQGQDTAGNRAHQKDSITVNPPLSIENPLPGGTVGVPYEHSLGVGGGVAPYTYLLTASGEIPPGLGINNTTGTLEGTPSKLGTYCFGVYIADAEFPKATLDTQTCVTIGDQLTLDPGSLPAAIERDLYEVNVTGAGGYTGGYTYTLAVPASCETGYTCAASLPTGLTLAPSGSITTLGGTPTTAGKYEFAIHLSDGVGGLTERDYMLTVEPSSAGLTGIAPVFTSADEATVTAGSSEHVAIAASGTPAPVITMAGTLPAGMSFGEGAGGTAEISGTPGAGATGVYALTLTAQNGFSPSATQTFTLTVDAGPSITTQPTDQTATAPAGTATFTAGAGGTPAPTVQWEESADNGSSWAPLAGENSPTLALSGLEPEDNGREYRAVFTNTRGSATTNAAKLTVDYAPQLGSGPSDQAIDAGEDATFTAAATGEPAPTAQWQLSSDGGVTWTDISGATSATLPLEGVPAKDDGNEYRVVFANSRGTATSSAATLTVQTAPLVSLEPAGETIDAGGEAVFTTSAGGNPAPAVQWQVSSDSGASWNDLSAGSGVSGATSSTLTLTNVPSGDDGYRYRAVFSNAADVAGVDSAAATLTVQTAPTIATQPLDRTVDAGGEAVFTAAATGRPAPTVRWQVSSDGGATWSEVTGASAATSTTSGSATSATLTLGGVSAGEDGDEYRAVFGNAADVAGVDSAAATLTVQTAPVVSSQPAGQTTPAGGAATFSAAASGRPAPSIQWQVSGDGGSTWTNVTGAGAPSLTLANVPARDDGQLYRAVFANAVGTVTSSAAQLTVLSPPTIVTPPSGETVVPGGGVVLTITASGTPAPSLQWLVSEDGGKTWTDVPGANSPSLALSHVSASENGYLYKVLIVNSQGSTTSRPVTLVVSLQAVSAATACRPAPTKLVYPRRNLGPVVRYVVYVDGHRRKTVHGRKLRSAELPKMTGARHVVKIVSTTSHGYRLSTTRVYVDCAEVAKHVKAKHTGNSGARR